MALLDVRHLVKEFPRRPGFGAGRGPTVRAVDEVSFQVESGEIFALVGESGSGKTTTARCVLRLVEPTSGQVIFREKDVCALDRQGLKALRREMQMVFQDPYSSLTPHMEVGGLVEEPLIVHGIGTKEERKARVEELFRLVGLDPALMRRRPAEFSGGQRQRIGLARALALEPSLLVADEPVSALDVQVQTQIVDLLRELHARLGLTYLLIAHDLRLVRRLCSRVAVMLRGRVVELAPTAALFSAPAHPYTRALLSAIPVPDPSARPVRIDWNPEEVELARDLAPVGDGHWARI